MLATGPAVVLASISADLTSSNGASSAPALSADGRFVAFASAANNLINGDTNNQPDIFVYDKQNGVMQRITASPQGDAANGASSAPTISGDGRYIAFVSSATNLVAGDTNGFDDIFVYDRQVESITRISVAPGVLQANDRSQNPAISFDGQFIAFASRATNLVSGDTNNALDVFRYEMSSGTIARVSVSSPGAEGNFFSDFPAISSDGRYIAFSSVANNLVPNDTNSETDVFRRDMQLNSTLRVSVSTLGEQASGTSQNPAISGDGRFVAFESSAPNLVDGDTNGVADVFLRDTTGGVSLPSTLRVSVAYDGTESDGISNLASISQDGDLITFSSLADNLVPTDTNNAADVFVYGVASASTQRLSLSNTRLQADASSTSPALSPDGRYLTFSSAATNLVTGDTNVLTDIFIAAVNLVPVIAFVTDAPDPVKKPGNLVLSATGVADADGTVAAVLFYRDANANGVFDLATDTLVATDSDGSNGWFASVATNAFTPGINTFFAVARDDFNDLGAAVTTTATVVVSKAFDSRHKVKFKDASGDVITIRMGGPGAGEVLLTAENNVNPSSILLTSTTDKTRLSISVTGKGGKKTTIGNILSAGPLRSISGGKATLTGEINVAGSVDKITLMGVTGVPHVFEDDGNTGASITLLAAPDPRDPLKLKLGRVRELSINSGMPIKSIAVTDWLNEDGLRDAITAPYIGKISTKGEKRGGVAGDFEAGLSLSGTLNPKHTLTKLSVKGKIGSSLWNIIGDVQKITAAGFSGDMDAVVTANIDSIKTPGDFAGNFTTGKINKIKIKGDFRNAHLFLTQPATARGVSLNSIAIKGVMADSSIRAAGDLGSITTSAMKASQIFAGVKLSVVALPGSVADFANTSASIGSIVVKGTKIRALESYSNSLIAAGVLKKVSLKNIDVAEGLPEFGVSGVVIKSFSRNGAPRRVDLTTSGTYDTLGSFVLKVPTGA